MLSCGKAEDKGTEAQSTAVSVTIKGYCFAIGKKKLKS
jgi:hypothetical protein